MSDNALMFALAVAAGLLGYTAGIRRGQRYASGCERGGGVRSTAQALVRLDDVLTRLRPELQPLADGEPVRVTTAARLGRALLTE